MTGNASMLRTGDMIAFKRSRKISSRIVHFFTRSEVNHVAMVIKLYNRNGKGFDFLLEANTGRGVEYNYLPAIMKSTSSQLYVYRLSEENLQKFDAVICQFYDWANKQVGKDYSKRDAVEVIIDKIYADTITEDRFNQFICSTLMGGLYQAGGIITPDMLKKLGFQTVSEFTPVDCCNLPIFENHLPLSEFLQNGELEYA